MADLSLDLNNGSSTYRDLLFVNSDLVLTSDVNATYGTNPILQDILTRLRFFLGEWYLDNTQGIPWYQRILVKNPNQSDIDAIFQNCIAGTPGVDQLTSYSFTVNRATRVLTVNFSCLTTLGTVNYTGTLAPVSGGTI